MSASWSGSGCPRLSNVARVGRVCDSDGCRFVVVAALLLLLPVGLVVQVQLTVV